MDKKVSRITAPILFSDGESLSAAKLNAAFANLYRGISDLEALMGDPQDTAAPYGEAAQLSQASFNEEESEIAAGKDLNIVNISRLIGPAEALNPHHLKDTSYQLTEILPSDVTKFKLKYSGISNDPSFLPSVLDANLTTFVAANGPTGDPAVAGDWWVDYNAGILHSVSEMTGGTITYYLDPESIDQLENYAEASFNVIPDPNQSTKCTVSLEDPGIPSYLLELPYITDQQRNEDNTSTQLEQEAGSLNFEKQLRLPFVLRGMVEGDDIPLNFLMVKNLTTNRYLTGVTYSYVTESSLLIRGAVLDEGHEYQVITVGTSITETIKDLNRKLTALRLGRAGRHVLLASKIVNDIDGYPNSGRPGNVLPQYLHRDGAEYPMIALEVTPNDLNGMRGTLLMLAETKDANGTYANLEYSTQRIRFGTLIGPSLRFVPGGSPSMSYLELDAGSAAADVRVINGKMRVDEGYSTGAGAADGPFKWAKVTYNSALTGAGSNEISIDVLDELDITASQILSITGGLYLYESGSGDSIFIGLNQALGGYEFEPVSGGSYGSIATDGTFEIKLNAALAALYSAASSGNRQLKLFVHYED